MSGMHVWVLSDYVDVRPTNLNAQFYHVNEKNGKELNSMPYT